MHIKVQLISFILFFLFKSGFSTDIKLCDAPNGFPLSVASVNTVVYCDANEPELVKIAASLLCSDIEMVTGIKPTLTHSKDSLTKYSVIVGTLTNSSLIKELIQSSKINTAKISNGWEQFKIETINKPITGVDQALVIAGSDRRGTAYGIFELSKAIGVSPWYWWADVTPRQKDALYLCTLDYTSNEPTVKYRGIFINDEDWGLQEWAQYTFDPVKDIGPKTYEKVCELLLRLKANYLWPAMHPCTKPFNHYANNKVVADRYGILMGSSHHEPLLYNTEEWPYSDSEWNPFTHLDKIMGELEERVASNGKYENVYTVGIRGTGDGSVAGGSSLNDKTAKLEEVISRERELLSKYVNSDILQVPQVFWPYKEVMDQYNNNMNLPDDITLGWVDDNHGYIRQVSNPSEQMRSGGSGVYYHISYWGSPRDYLWIASTQPALIASEMKKAATFGGDRIWIFNVGDIKPAEMLTNFCLDLAWDYNKWGPQNVNQYINEWAAFNFGDEFAEDITRAYVKYFQLAQAAKPEHINEVDFSEMEVEQRLSDYEEIAELCESVKRKLPTVLQDAFFETVYYPIVCAGLMNQKFLYAQRSFTAAIRKDPDALNYSQKALDAFNSIKTHTKHYNTEIKNGKWNKIISSDIRSQNVYDMPPVATQNDVNKEYVELADIDLSSGIFEAPMKYVNGLVYGTKAGKQEKNTGGKAEFTFELTKAIKAEIYFYAKTPTVEEDSWYINVNGHEFVQNDYATGDNFEWLKVSTENLPAGTNKITIIQREPNAQIARIKITEPGLLQYTESFKPKPDTIIPAWKFETMHNAQGYTWEVIEGLSTSEKAVCNSPLTLPGVSKVLDAPYIEQNINRINANFTLELRCMPTRRLYEGRNLRVGISINGETPEVFSIQKPYPTLEWEANVLRGYTKTLLRYDSINRDVNIKLYALDPGVIFDKILIYKNEIRTDTTSQDITSFSDYFIDQSNDIKVFPNPVNEQLYISFTDEICNNISFEISDLTGKVLINKSSYTNNSLNNFIIPVSTLSKGVYILNISDDNKHFYRKFEKM